MYTIYENLFQDNILFLCAIKSADSRTYNRLSDNYWTPAIERDLMIKNETYPYFGNDIYCYLIVYLEIKYKM